MESIGWSAVPRVVCLVHLLNGGPLRSDTFVVSTVKQAARSLTISSTKVRARFSETRWLRRIDDRLSTASRIDNPWHGHVPWKKCYLNSKFPVVSDAGPVEASTSSLLQDNIPGQQGSK